MLSKYKLVQAIDNTNNLLVYALVKGGHEVAIGSTYREYKFDALVRRLGSISVENWQRTFSPSHDIKRVYMESRTKAGMLKKLRKEYPEYFV